MQSPTKNPLQRPCPKRHHQPMQYSPTKSILCSTGYCGLSKRSLNWIPKWETLWQVSPTPELPSCRAPTPSKHTRTSYSKCSGLLKTGKCVGAGLELKSAGWYLSRSRVRDPSPTVLWTSQTLPNEDPCVPFGTRPNNMFSLQVPSPLS